MTKRLFPDKGITKLTHYNKLLKYFIPFLINLAKLRAKFFKITLKIPGLYSQSGRILQEKLVYAQRRQI